MYKTFIFAHTKDKPRAVSYHFPSLQGFPLQPETKLKVLGGQRAAKEKENTYPPLL